MDNLKCEGSIKPDRETSCDLSYNRVIRLVGASRFNNERDIRSAGTIPDSYLDCDVAQFHSFLGYPIQYRYQYRFLKRMPADYPNCSTNTEISGRDDQPEVFSPISAAPSEVYSLLTCKRFIIPDANSSVMSNEHWVYLKSDCDISLLSIRHPSAACVSRHSVKIIC
jgi:hypothetical protein